MFNADQKRAFYAVVLSGLVLFGWQYFYASKFQPKKETTNVVTPTATTPAATTSSPSTTPGAELKPGTETAAVAPTTLQTLNLRRDKYDIRINNDLSVVDMENPNSVFDFKALSDSHSPLKIQVVTDYGPMDLMFQTEQSADKITGYNQNFGVSFSAFIKENGRVHIALKSDKPYKYRLVFEAQKKKLDNGQIRHFTYFTNKTHTVTVSDDEDADGTLKWAGIDYNYHLFAAVLGKDTPARFKITEKGQMFIDIPTASKEFDTDLVFTKKNYDDLLALGDNLHQSVDFGFFAILAVPMLRALQFIYKFIPNYGLAIILVTILIRLITFPLQYKSFKSMKKMQAIQPELTKIKEKYKDEPQKMQKETMELFKKAGANPLSGCLPLILQMPFFFAIYRVLYSSVELVGSPFFGWIHDLSIHDPFYVLPVLMAGAMFAQQKFTPTTTMDPTQQKIMLFMPIIFGFIMKSLPAGLVLYILVSTVMGLLQQMLVYRMND
jgi:YidC/Oxa1 family membrane protein insertase